MVTSVALALIFLSPVALALGLGEEIPSFRVVAGDGTALGKLDLLGNVSVIFYEDRQSVEINSSLKYALGNLVESDRDRYGAVRFVQIVDASSANFLTRTIWKRMLLKKSREAGIPVYADWKGSLIGRLGLVRGTSNVLIIDRKGVLRYREVGPIQSEKLNRFYSILDELTGST